MSRRKLVLPRWIVAFAPLVVVAVASCGGHFGAMRLGGMSPEEAFPGIDGRLVRAAVDGDTATMERLVREGANPNAKGAQSVTPILWTLAAHNHRGLEKLLELGADPNARFLARGNYLTATWVAASANDYESFKILVEHGGDPNAACDCRTPLMAAIGTMDLRKVDFLLAHGADINGEACGEDAAEYAAVLGRFDIVLYLFSKGYDTHLNRLAEWMRYGAVPKDSQAYRDKMKVTALLRERGVTIPAPKH